MTNAVAPGPSLEREGNKDNNPVKEISQPCSSRLNGGTFMCLSTDDTLRKRPWSGQRSQVERGKQRAHVYTSFLHADVQNKQFSKILLPGFCVFPPLEIY